MGMRRENPFRLEIFIHPARAGGAGRIRMVPVHVLPAHEPVADVIQYVVPMPSAAVRLDHGMACRSGMPADGGKLRVAGASTRSGVRTSAIRCAPGTGAGPGSTRHSACGTAERFGRAAARRRMRPSGTGGGSGRPRARSAVARSSRIQAACVSVMAPASTSRFAARYTLSAAASAALAAGGGGASSAGGRSASSASKRR
jgi:hypothetical protein